jgi:hypothetical protein
MSELSDRSDLLVIVLQEVGGRRPAAASTCASSSISFRNSDNDCEQTSMALVRCSILLSDFWELEIDSISSLTKLSGSIGEGDAMVELERAMMVGIYYAKPANQTKTDEIR